MNDKNILRVAINSPLRILFDYLIPDTINKSSILPGSRVRVPFGKSTRIGVITEIVNHSDCPEDKLKPIYEILDEDPLFSGSILKLIHWAAAYYHCPIGEVFERAMPLWLRKGKIFAAPKIEKLSLETSETHILERKLTFLKCPSPLILNDEQMIVMNTLSNHLGQFSSFLLEGVTGSGKTEIYMRTIEQVLEKNQQALVLVPEIGLTPQMFKRLEERFNVPIAMLHSSVSPKKRFLAWQMAKTGEAPIIIGTRSAIFTPLKTPGVFILDEEHDSSFKQQNGFRYNARDLLMLRAKYENCPAILGTATPSLETLQNVRVGRYQELKLTQRAGFSKPPEIQILDIRHKKLEEGLSSQLIQMIHEHLENKSQVLLFLNRRGFAPVLMCFDCGEVFICKHCDAHVTLHYSAKKLICHHCETQYSVPETCSKCQSLNLKPLGVGTERLEKVLCQHFPNHNVMRMDRDTTRKKDSLQNTVDAVSKGEAHILIGTQMIAKGHHFPNVTLVAILDIDNALFSSDFRSLEHLGQLLTQVAGRSGREERLGKCVLQTCHPDHPLLRTLLEKGYRYFAEQLLMEREATELPPFSYQALIRVEAKTNIIAFGFLKKLKQYALAQKSFQNVSIQGPIAAVLERRAGRFHAQLLLQAKQRTKLQALIKLLIAYAEQHPQSQLKWFVDIDPLD